MPQSKFSFSPVLHAAPFPWCYFFSILCFISTARQGYTNCSIVYCTVYQIYTHTIHLSEHNSLQHILRCFASSVGPPFLSQKYFVASTAAEERPRKAAGNGGLNRIYDGLVLLHFCSLAQYVRTIQYTQLKTICAHQAGKILSSRASTG